MQSGFFHLVSHVCGNIALHSGLDGLLADHIHHAFKEAFLTDGDMYLNGIDAGVLMNGFQGLVVIGMFVIHAIHQDYFTLFLTFHLFQSKLKTHFETACGIGNDHHIFHRGQSNDGITYEVRITRRVEDV